MIDIMHCKPGEYASLIHNKIIGQEIVLKINRELVVKDIERLKGLVGTLNKTDDSNIKIIIKHLEKMLSKLNTDSEITICWVDDKNKITDTYPIKMFNEPVYGVSICNYIELASDESMIILNLEDIADIVAFEYIFKELDETHDSIEELMKNCSIMGYNKADVLTDKFKADKENMYYLSKILRIGESPWVNIEDGVISDYFNTKEFKADKYDKVVEYSCITIAFAIMNSIIRKCIKLGISYKPVMSTANAIAIVVDNKKGVDVKRDLLDIVSIQVFGRQLIVDTKPQIL